METTCLPDKDQRQIEAEIRAELERWQRAKEREQPSMSDKAFAFRLRRLLDD